MSFSNCAHWIWQNKNAQKNEYVQFIKDFIIDEIDVEFHLKISADTAYVAWLNGEFINCGQFSDFVDYKLYDELDITRYIQKGFNRLCILSYSHNENTFWYVKNIASVIFEIVKNKQVIISSDSTTLARLAPDYLQGEIYKITGQLGYSFCFDNQKDDGWNLNGYSPEIFIQAICVHNNSKLFKKPIQKLDILPSLNTLLVSQGVFLYKDDYDTVAEKMQNAFLSHKRIDTISNRCEKTCLPSKYGICFDYHEKGIYLLIDLGQEEAGFFTIDIKTDDGTKIDIAFGEHIDDLRVRSSVSGRCFAFEYICKEGRNTYTNFIKRFGLRYLQLYIHSNRFTLYYAGIKPVRYPIKQSMFRIDDALHQQIYDTSIRTLQLCMHEHYEDCPWREQALWLMDTRNQMICGYYAFGNYLYAKHCLLLISKGIRDDHHLSMCCPTKACETIPSFTLSYFLAVYEYIQFSGDIAFIYEIKDVLEKVINVFINRIENNGLIKAFEGKQYWNFYEWSEGLDTDYEYKDTKKSYDAPLNAFLSIAIDRMSKLYSLILEDDTANYYAKIAGKINNAIEKNFWSEQKQLFGTFIRDGKLEHYSELTQSLIVYCGAAKNNKASIVLNKMVNLSNNLIPITIAYSVFKFDALLQTDSEKYQEYVLTEIEKNWGHMLYKGATSFWETIKGGDDFDYAGSLCHGWSAIPIYIYKAYVLGIRPSGICGEFLFQPIKSRFHNVEGELNTVNDVLKFKK